MLKYFNGKIISTSSILPLFAIWSVIFALRLNESIELFPLSSTILPFTAAISLKYCHKLPYVFE